MQSIKVDKGVQGLKISRLYIYTNNIPFMKIHGEKITIKLILGQFKFYQQRPVSSNCDKFGDRLEEEIKL